MTNENKVRTLGRADATLLNSMELYLNSFGEDLNLSGNPIVLCSSDTYGTVNGTALLHLPITGSGNGDDIGRLSLEQFHAADGEVAKAMIQRSLATADMLGRLGIHTSVSNKREAEKFINLGFSTNGSNFSLIKNCSLPRIGS